MPPFSVGVHIVSLLSVRAPVPSYPICNKNGFRSIFFEKISVLDSNFIYR